MKKVLILGAGGHAQVVADILLRASEAGEPLQPIGFLDDREQLRGQSLLNLPILGSIAALPAIQHDAVVIAIGANAVRRELFARLSAANEEFVVARHPSAIVAPDVEIGPGTMICAGAIVNTGSVIGANVILNTASSADHHNRIGDHVHIAPGVRLGGDVTIGAGALIGIGATVMPQRTIGAWSTVGAGALVHRDVAENSVVVGVPARPVRTTRS